MNIKVKKNAAWIIGCKIAQSILAFVISMLTARYMGPSNYGLLTYAQSIGTFVVPLMQLGLNWIIVYELINDPENEPKILGTSILLSLGSGLFCIIGIFMFTSFVNTGEHETILVCVLYSINLLFQAVELIQYWFQSKYLSKYTSVVSLIAYVIVSGYKVFLLVTKKSVAWFAISYSIDYFLISFTLLYLYKHLTNNRLCFSMAVAKKLLSKSKYYIITGLMINVFLQTDRVMLKLMLGNASNGIYSAAATCAGVGGFVFLAIIDSMRPFILQNKKDNNGLFEYSTMQLYSIIIYSAFLYAFALTVFSNIIVMILYGKDYSASAGVLRILSWCMILQYYGGAKDIWILAEEKQKYLIPLNFTGAISNIVLNYIFIQLFAEKGAAIASLLTMFITNVAMIAIIPALRHNTHILIQSTNPKYMSNAIRSIINNVKRKNTNN